MPAKIEAKKLIDKMQEIYDMSNYKDFTIDENDNQKNDELWEKNRELFNAIYREFAKQAALIAVDEILDEVYRWTGGDNTEWDVERIGYLNEVKQEIKNYKETVN